MNNEKAIKKAQKLLPPGFFLKRVLKGFFEVVRYEVIDSTTGKLIVSNQTTPKEAVQRALAILKPCWTNSERLQHESYTD